MLDKGEEAAKTITDQEMLLCDKLGTETNDLTWERKTTIIDESWMNIPITFPPVPARDLSEEALVMEAEIERYLVRGIHDEGHRLNSVYIEHCFYMLPPKIKGKASRNSITVSGFHGEKGVKVVREVELDVCFGVCRTPAEGEMMRQSFLLYMDDDNSNRWGIVLSFTNTTSWNVEGNKEYKSREEKRPSGRDGTDGKS
ncbi:hypothetical protein Tco_1228103 [Tanacetum coccineum]